jgi:SAM-dependent methyltransferase
MLGENFTGFQYQLCNNWFDVLPIEEYKNRPITFLEIGTLSGANLIAVSKTYGSHEYSKLYCIDPWEDYEDYKEYKGIQNTIYGDFINNISNEKIVDKVIINRGYSNNEILKFPDNFFDMIYIDGNHEPEYCLEDAVLSYRKLKTNGIMIFDDYGWGGPDKTKRGIDAFLSGYVNRVHFIAERNTQVFVRKI